MGRSRLLALLLLNLPCAARAHSPIEGIGEFYGGMLHPLLVPAHALALLIFSLLVGQRGVRAMRLAYPSFAVALAAGLSWAGYSLSPAPPVETALLGLAACCGLLVALHWPVPLFVFALLGALLGAVIGADSGVAGLSRQETFAALFGAWTGAVVSMVLVAGVAELIQRPWQRVAVRVVGSWGSASAVLVLALALR